MCKKTIIKTILGIILITTIGIMLVGCDDTLRGIKEIIHTIVGGQNPEVIILEYDNDKDFDATFLVWNNSLTPGTQVRLAKREAPTFSNRSSQPHLVSKVFTVEIDPDQDFDGFLLLMVKDEYTQGSGQPLSMYFWRPFIGTATLLESTGGAVSQNYQGYWQLVEGSTDTMRSRSIDNASHITENQDVNKYMSTDDNKKSADFAVADPGPNTDPWQQWLNTNGKSNWTDEPTNPDPDNYEYVGFSVFHNSVGVHTTLSNDQLEAPFLPTDMDLLYTNSTMENKVLNNDIIISHHYRPKVAD